MEFVACTRKLVYFSPKAELPNPWRVPGLEAAVTVEIVRLQRAIWSC